MGLVTLKGYADFIEYLSWHGFKKTVFEYPLVFLSLAIFLMSLILTIILAVYIDFSENVWLFVTGILMIELFIMVTGVTCPSKGKKNGLNRFLMKFF